MEAERKRTQKKRNLRMTDKQMKMKKRTTPHPKPQGDLASIS